MNQQNSKNILLGLALLVVIGGAVFWFIYSKAVAYTIPNVPYYGIYTYQGELSKIPAPAHSALLSILDYWSGDSKNLAKVLSLAPDKEPVDATDRYGISSVASFVESLGNYNVAVESLSLPELKKYINKDRRAPLFVFIANKDNLSLDTSFNIASVLIGINEKENKLIFHHYWFGNNYELSFSDFLSLNHITKNGEALFLIIEPKDKMIIDKVKTRIENPYVARTDTMIHTQKMWEDAVNGIYLTRAQNEKDPSLVINYLESVIKNPDFNLYFPPFFKVDVFGILAGNYAKKHDFKNAHIYLDEAQKYNNNLNKPKESWPGFENTSTVTDPKGRSVFPYKVLGDIYFLEKDYKKAATAYRTALSIYPKDAYAALQLKRVEPLLK